MSGSAVREEHTSDSGDSYLHLYIMAGGLVVVLVLAYFVVAHAVRCRRANAKPTKVVPVGDNIIATKARPWNV